MRKTIYFLMICFAGILFSCSEDEGIQNDTNQVIPKNTFKRNIVSFQDMKVKLSENSCSSLGLFSDLTAKDGDDYIQAIDSTYIIQYSNDSLATYTMKVNTLDDDNYDFSNLVIKVKNGQTEAFILHYSPSDEWKTAYANGEYINYDGDIHMTDIQGRAACTTTIIPIVEYDCDCSYATPTVVGYWIHTSCMNFGGDGEAGSGTPTGPYPGGFDPEDGNSTYNGGDSAFTAFLNLVSNVSTDAFNWLVDSDNSVVLTQIYNYLEHNYYSDSSIDFALWAVEYLMENPDVKFNALLNIKNALEINPNFLLDIPCTQIPYWQQVTQHQIPQSVINKINNINSQTGWFTSAEIVGLTDAEAPTVNLDFFPVTISEFPTNPNTGQPYTPNEFLNYIRLNINSLVNSSLSQFYPVVNSTYGINENALWNSNNPLGTLITIDIPTNDGSVVCSGYGTDYWIFSTMETPWDLSHPVSGNRKFGYYLDVNGNYVYYTRGVDRITFFDYHNYHTTEAISFASADALWESFQSGISQYVNSHGGNSSVNNPVKYRPNFLEVKGVLTGDRPISDLGCD